MWGGALCIASVSFGCPGAFAGVWCWVWPISSSAFQGDQLPAIDREVPIIYVDVLNLNLNFVPKGAKGATERIKK